KIEKITKKYKVSKSMVMFNFIKAYSEFIDYVVIGVNSIDELKQNYNEFSKPFNYSIFNECININKSIMPYYKKINNWKYL
ncbi:hypothetical protein N9L61_05520, partial [Flavobacteriaceae bacterium]|nr:hypothetical protein [Flavobacteriaceae bacterium]